MDDLFIQSGHASVSKHGETLCGDAYHISRRGDKLTAVLSDGLGSGVKANILSTLTATILSTLMSRTLSLDECVETMAVTLPMCRERKLAYSTFTAAEIERGRLHLVQYDNPFAILLRDGKSVDYEKTLHFIGEKELSETTVEMRENDMLLLFSDGVTNAGIGKLSPDGWGREDLTACVERWYVPGISPQRLAAMIVNAASTLCEDSPDDDITVLAFQARPRRAVNVLLGPPRDAGDDNKILRLFFAKEGAHVVCGGTTAKTVGRFLDKPVLPVEGSGSDAVPVMAQIEGVDLVTEGVLTLQRTIDLMEKALSDGGYLSLLSDSKDGAACLAQLLIEQATDVTFYYGQAGNPGNEGSDIDFETKTKLLSRLKELLESAGKKVRVSLC